MSKIAYLFPGQGSQYVGMGKDFFDTFAVARQTFEEAEDILAYKISDILFRGPEKLLTQTKHSQLAIFIHSVAILRTIFQQLPEIKPYVCAGLSLGEYTALHTSGRLDFDKALKLVRDRAHFMNDACEKTSGTMAAVLGLSAAQLEELVNSISEEHKVWVANYNCPFQTVISGTQDGITYATKLLKKHGAKRVMPLTVHGAFHSGLMQSAQQNLSPKIIKTPIVDSETKLVMNVPGNFVEDLDLIKEYLVKQITNSVRWEQSVQTMMNESVDCYLEIGSGKTLSGINKKMGLGPLTKSVDKVMDLDVLISQMDGVFVK